VSGKAQAIEITPSTGLSKEEIDRMIHEARQFAESDRKAREIAQLHSRIQGHAVTISRSYSEYGWLLSAAEQDSLKASVRKAREISEKDQDIQALNKLLADLEACAARLTAAMFSAPGGSAAKPEPSPEEDAGDEDVQRAMRSALDQSRSKPT
jgi:molecular chaperone DnaK